MKKYLIAIMALVLIETVIGLGVGPAITRIDFEPNLTTQYKITVYNTDHKAFTASLDLFGELKEYLLLESQEVIFNSDDDKKEIYFTVSFPRDIPPGQYNSKINILELPVNSQDNIVTSISLTHDISLEVPTHGKYIKEVITETDDEVLLSIRNIGLKEIENLSVISIISDSADDRIMSFSRKNFLSDEVFNVTIPLNIPSGSYTHKILLSYDELKKEIRRTLRVGELELQIIDINIKEFNIGDIAAIQLDILSNWNEQIKVFAEIEIFFDSEEISTITGPDFLIKGSESTTLFWDTNGFGEGEYVLLGKIYYEDEEIGRKEFTIKLKQDGAKLVSGNAYITAIILVIITLALLTFLFILKKRQNRKK